MLTAALALALPATAPAQRGGDREARLPPTLADLLRVTPADSLAPVLRRFELRQTRAADAAGAAFTLGQLHYARGEYRLAGDAFARAAARLEPAQKPEARYWAGLCRLALREPAPARAMLEEVADAGGPRATEARLAVALAWELAGRDEAAAEALERVLAAGPGEVTPAALERLAAAAERLGRGDEARRVLARLKREWPASVEAARAPRPVENATAAMVRPAPAARPAERAAGPIEVLLGAFADDARARTLVERAKRAGFSSAAVVTRGEGATRVHVVRLGVFPSEAEARAAGARAADTLGVTYRLERRP